MSTRFPIHECPKTRNGSDLFTTKAEFESLLRKSAQPLEPEPKPLPEVEQTSESQSSGDCNETHTR